MRSAPGPPLPAALRALAWAGGGAFVVALAACGWFFAVVLARPDVPGSAPA